MSSQTTGATVIRGGRVIDPANGIDEIRDLYLRGGLIVAPEPYLLHGADATARDGLRIIDAQGLVVAPGLIDLHVHFREPGQSAKETIETGSRAAAAGGFTSVVCMPNTSPAADSPATVAWINERARQKACINVFPTGAITKGLAGEELAPIASMLKEGIVAITDDGHCVQNHELMRRAVEYARMFDLPVLDHCQDYSLVGEGVMNEGYWSTVLGLPGWPAAGEELIVMRNAVLAELCRSPIHCQHLSCAGSVRHLREARSRGVRLTGEVCAHHIALTDESVRGFDSNYKMNPPLRTRADIDALIGGIADGTITILASDHAPHSAVEKEVEFDRAPFGILGLETEFGLFHHILVEEQKAIGLPRLIELLTVNPAQLLKLDRGTLSVGKAADVTLIDPGLEWTVDIAASASRSRNSPFGGWRLKGRAVRTIVDGETVWAL
jgi:dihydroorotase